MSAPLFIPMPGNQAMAAALAAICGGVTGMLDVAAFPDGESHLRFMDDLVGRSVILVCTLDRPNDKVLPLLMAADAARDLSARKLGLVAPYLCYMRQDRRFESGEAVTSRSFASLLSAKFDWLATVDPHLHRYHALGEIYSIPARALHAGPALAAWISAHVENPFLVGPDEESRQWVGAVAAACGAKFTVFAKERMGDRLVRTMPGDLKLPGNATPVLLDDIISTGVTMLEAARLVKTPGARPPVLICIHGVLADRGILDADLVTTNSIPNPAAKIDIAPIIAGGISDLIA
jgi:ribose-phosphate pyrophosphokinase